MHAEREHLFLVQHAAAQPRVTPCECARLLREVRGRADVRGRVAQFTGEVHAAADGAALGERHRQRARGFCVQTHGQTREARCRFGFRQGAAVTVSAGFREHAELAE